MMKRSRPVVLLAVLLAASSFPAWTQSGLQDDQGEIRVELTGQTRARQRLAVPDPAGLQALSPAGRKAATDLINVLRQDLAASGVFVVQGPLELSVLELTGDPLTDYVLYQSLGNELLLDTDLTEEPGRLVLEGRVFNLASANSVVGKRYRGGFELARRIAHTFADEIVFYFTGRRGVALTSIAFHSDRDAAGRREIYLMDYDGHNQRAITAHETLSMSPDWSPRSDFIAYVSYLSGGPGLHLVELRSGRKAPIVTEGDFNISPSFSPDGKTIAFSRSVGKGNTEIFLCNRDGSDLQRLTTARGIDTNPAWSPTGRELAFTSSRSGTPQIYLMSAEGSDLRRITFLGRYNDGAAWSPDGTKLAHSARRADHSFDIAVTDLVTQETRYLTESAPGSHESPSYSPDGKKLAYAANLSSRSGTTTQIFTMDLAGGGRRQLTRSGNNFAPSWSGYSQP
jgi:TolB protein